MTYLEKAKDIYRMIFEGRLLEAFEKYYAEDVVMQELGQEPRIGKAVNREFEINFLNNVAEMHGMELTCMASNEAEKTVFIQNWMDFTSKDGTRMKVVQVNVQNWEGDFIVKEVFYHVNDF
jgi:predicted DNA-binding protein YlxM (UPF0122 family)